jgi:hypothetical protein
MPGYLPCGGAAIEDDYLPRLDHLGGRATDRDLAFWSEQLTSGEVGDSRRRGESSAMNTMEKTFLREFSQIAADGVLGDPHGLADFLCDDLSVSLEK